MAKGSFFVIYDVEDAGEVMSSIPTQSAGPTGAALEPVTGSEAAVGVMQFKKEAFKEWGIENKEITVIDRPKRCKIVRIEAESGKPEEAAKIVARVMGTNRNSTGLALKSGAKGYAVQAGEGASSPPKVWVATEANIEEKAAV